MSESQAKRPSIGRRDDLSRGAVVGLAVCLVLTASALRVGRPGKRPVAVVAFAPGDRLSQFQWVRRHGQNMIASIIMTSSRQHLHDIARIGRARVALEGLSVGDAFGGKHYLPPGSDRVLPTPPWRYSDDTVMAEAIVEVLARFHRTERDELALCFARRYQADPYRGYGLSVRRVLDQITEGVSWNIAAQEVFGGSGSMGNGGAMRVAPLGAYFADDFDEVAEQARASAEVTHAHPEGQAGAIATAIAAAWAWQIRDQPKPRSGREMLEIVLEFTPAGETRAGLEKSLSLGFDSTIEAAVEVLGNGSLITSSDTVPFALWCAARHLDDYAEALWATVSAGGDNDTNCAIVGGIVVLANGLEAIPADWLAAREPLGGER